MENIRFKNLGSSFSYVNIYNAYMYMYMCVYTYIDIQTIYYIAYILQNNINLIFSGILGKSEPDHLVYVEEFYF